MQINFLAHLSSLERKVNTADLLFLFFRLLLSVSAFVLLLMNQTPVREALELKEHLPTKAYKHNEPRATWASDKQPFLCYKGTHCILVLVHCHKTQLHWVRWKQLAAWRIHLIIHQWVLLLLCISKSASLMFSRHHYKMAPNVKGFAPANPYSLEYVTAKPWEEDRERVKYHLSSASNGITVLMDKDGIHENKPKSIETISGKTEIVTSDSISYLKGSESCYFLNFFEIFIRENKATDIMFPMQ